jgi:hypothetical protein
MSVNFSWGECGGWGFFPPSGIPHRGGQGERVSPGSPPFPNLTRVGHRDSGQE